MSFGRRAGNCLLLLFQLLVDHLEPRCSVSLLHLLRWSLALLKLLDFCPTLRTHFGIAAEDVVDYDRLVPLVAPVVHLDCRWWWWSSWLSYDHLHKRGLMQRSAVVGSLTEMGLASYCQRGLPV